MRRQILLLQAKQSLHEAVELSVMALPRQHTFARALNRRITTTWGQRAHHLRKVTESICT